jgi:hypothetical protein
LTLWILPAKKQRAADCGKILLDVAKESADWFPPLKSALGGVGALIKHYEVSVNIWPPRTAHHRSQESEDVKEKIEELIPQLGRFRQGITTTPIDEDPEETDRRSELARYVHRSMTATATLNSCCSTFKQIDKSSQELLAKGSIVRFLDKGEDSKVVARLIEQLREAIVRYQVDHHYPWASNIVDRRAGITTASDVSSNYSPRSKATPCCLWNKC